MIYGVKTAYRLSAIWTTKMFERLFAMRLRLIPLLAICVGATARSAPAQSTVPRLQITQDLRIDGNKEDFSVANNFAVGPHGDMAISFYQDAQVRIYDSTGKHLATIGRRGSGPGEFQQPAIEGWIGDTIWIVDHRMYRQTFVARDGKMLRTTALPAAVDRPQPGTRPPPGTIASRFSPHARSLDGSMLGSAAIAQAPGTARTDVFAIIQVSAAGAPRIVATVPTQDPRWDARFAYWPMRAYSPDGKRFGHVQVDNMTRSGSTITVSVFTADGDTVFVKPIPYAGVPMPSRVVDSVLTLQKSDGPDGGSRGLIATRKDRIPPIYVPVGEMLFARDGKIWVTIRESVNSEIAMILNDRGIPINTVSLPPRSRLVAANSIHVWMIEKDSDGIQSVVRYRISGSAR